MATNKKQTPLMKQYHRIKTKYPDAMLLFRVGDFYEAFGEDAIKAAEILDIVLTHRNNGGDNVELAGFPHHSLNVYLPKLVKAGQRVAICDQLEDPKKTKTIVKRGVTELVTPGVTLSDDILQSKTNNFLCAIHFGKQNIGVAFLDVSTGEFVTARGTVEYIDKLLQNFSPKEVLIPKTHKQTFNGFFGNGYHKYHLDDWIFKPDFAYESLTNHFKTTTLKGFGIEELQEGIIASGAVLYYLSETQHDKLSHIMGISRITDKDSVWMDRFTVRNLELYRTNNDSKNIALIDIIDQTQTAMGGRLIKRRMALPLKEVDAINRSLESVNYFKTQENVLEELRLYLSKIADLERLTSKIATAKISPREIIYLKKSLQAIPPIKTLLVVSTVYGLNDSVTKLNDCVEICTDIEQTLHEDAPVLLQKGNVIAKGYSAQLDELRELKQSGSHHLQKMLDREKNRTGIGSLKIAMNNVFGYYIEVRNSHKDKVPKDWIRKQTLVNAERYITEELKTYETKIFGAEEQIAAIEQRLFVELVNRLSQCLKVIKTNAKIISEIDLWYSFAKVSKDYGYTRPEINLSHDLIIKNGRHPVIERQMNAEKSYIPNDLYLSPKDQQIIIITGPNMSGKSAILRQTALIVLMAQMGCFVPCETAKIGVVDKIFTRVGASDNITMGESTFMVEMNEAASILNNISKRSLILLDEIGRGTSTYDGISIAWAITEYLSKHTTQPKTLFATHYHELNEMTNIYPNIKNYHVMIKQTRDQILFLRKLQQGGSHHSFGIHVAKMAGMPVEVIHKAKQLLKKLEKSHDSQHLSENIRSNQNDIQLSIFNQNDPALEEIRNTLLQVDLNTLTPIQALFKLSELQKQLKVNEGEIE